MVGLIVCLWKLNTITKIILVQIFDIQNPKCNVHSFNWAQKYEFRNDSSVYQEIPLNAASSNANMIHTSPFVGSWHNMSSRPSPFMSAIDRLWLPQKQNPLAYLQEQRQTDLNIPVYMYFVVIIQKSKLTAKWHYSFNF